MGAILTVGSNQYFFTSNIQAAKALELLSKGTLVEREYRDNGVTKYREESTEGHEWRTELNLKIVNQAKPLKPQLRLTGPSQ
jgi:hypothetical protein